MIPTRNLVFVAALIFTGKSFALNSDLVGQWVASSGDSSWARLDISQNMLATGYRVCSPDAACAERHVFQLTAYGESPLISQNYNVGSGHLVDTVNNFAATEILEANGNQLSLREYMQFNSVTDSANTVLQTTFTRR